MLVPTKEDICVYIAAWGRDKRTNKQQVFAMLITGCREMQGSGGTTLSFMDPRDDVPQGSSRTGCRHDPARLHVRYRLGTVGLWVAGQEGKAINISLLHLGGSQMKRSCHKGETLSILTVTQEDIKQQLHKAKLNSLSILHLKK